MSRPTVDIIADLRAVIFQTPLDGTRKAALREATVRLAELDADGRHRYRYLCTSGHHVGAIENDLTVCPARPVLGFTDGAPDYGSPCGAELRHYSADPAWELDGLDALRPPCPTCGGAGLIATVDSDGVHCPDCTYGRASFERLVRVFEAVHEHVPLPAVQQADWEDFPWHAGVDAAVDYLRGIK